MIEIVIAGPAASIAERPMRASLLSQGREGRPKERTLSEGEAGIAVLLATSVVVSVVTHARDPRIVRSIFVSAFASSSIFQVLAYLHVGYLDPFFIIAFIVGAGVALAVSTVVGLVFRAYRARGSRP